MRKRKQYFGARRRWPDSPRQQKLQVTWDIEAYSGVGSEGHGIYEHLQSLEVDMLSSLPTMGISASMLNGGFPLGTFFPMAMPNPRPEMMTAHRLQAMLNNGLQGKLIICLEDAYTHPHYVPYHDFDKLRVETPDADIRAPNW